MRASVPDIELAEGKVSVVFCDVDETVIRGKSLVGFAQCLARSLSDPERAVLEQALASLSGRLRGQEPRGLLNQDYYSQVLGGRSEADVRDVVRAWFEDANARGNFFKPAVCRLLAQARVAGGKIVLLSGSFRELLEPIAAELGASDVLAAPLERAKGRFTGRLLREPTIGSGKLDALLSYATGAGVSLAQCAGVGDDLTDLPFLDAVGSPFVPFDGHPQLLEHARSNGWCILPDDNAA